jgi:diguanylate cyclase (GGDEF)-like protein
MNLRETLRAPSGLEPEDQIGRPVLVVEDQRALALLLSGMLKERWGCVVHVAGTLHEAKELLAGGHAYLAALCDIHLPDAEHGEVIDAVTHAQIPVIAMTAAFGDELRESILKKGVVDYVLKDSINAYRYVCELVGRLSKNRSIKVLAVDDSLSIRALLKQTLELYGLQVLVAADGNEGLEVLQQNPDIRLMLVDYYMPEMDGFALTVEARKTHGKDRLAIIGISGNEDPMFSARFLKNGANDFIRKPFHFEEVVCRVNQNLEMLELIETNQRAANCDFLTGLYNRRYFFVEGLERVSRARDSDKAMAVAMIDIDLFKSLNDNHGHDCGDLVLKMVAHQMATHFFQHLPARIGGEEFAVLMSGLSLEQATALVEGLRASIASAVVRWLDHEVRVSISAGVAVVADTGLDAAMRIADNRLYLAKASGRNRVVADDSSNEAAVA